MTDDIAPLIPILLDNFVTVRFPRISPEWECLQLRSESEWHRLGNRVRTERLIYQMRRVAYRMMLGEAGSRRFLDPIECRLTGDCRIHFLCADQTAVALIHQATMGTAGPGDPVDLKPVEYIEARLQRLKRQGRLISGDRWWDFDEQ